MQEDWNYDMHTPNGVNRGDEIIISFMPAVTLDPTFQKEIWALLPDGGASM